ncbi:MAG: DHA2 family efflux MFS transporter permease subunit [Phycisphaerae bacterium]|nr:DHA2 family efflux MFS transporter permease subunit [Phycisphaerae bacterium]
MLGVGLSIFMGTLDATIVNVSLPTLVDALHTDFATVQWVILAYVLVLTSLMLGVARLGDMWGKRRLFTCGICVFTLGSLLCAISPSIGWLVAFRTIQGIGAAMTQALGTAIVTEAFPSSERGRALGIIGSVVSVGLAMGPPLGGLMIGALGWRSVFMVNVPIGVIAITATLRFVPATAPARSGQRFDLAGAAIMFVTLACYALGMTLGQREGFGYGPVPVSFFVAVVGLLAFILLQKRLAQPMVDLTLFRDVFFGINLLMAWLVFIVVGGTFLLPFFLALVKGYDPETVGLLMMVVPVSMGLVAPAAGSLSDRFGPKLISLIGLIVIVAGCLAVASLRQEVGALGCVARFAPLGIGMGLFQSPNNSAVMGAVSRDRLGLASGLLALSRTLGSMTGIPLCGLIFTSHVAAAANRPDLTRVTTAPPQALVAGLAGTYHIAALIVAGSTLLAAVVLWIARRRAAIEPKRVEMSVHESAPPIGVGRTG